MIAATTADSKLEASYNLTRRKNLSSTRLTTSDDWLAWFLDLREGRMIMRSAQTSHRPAKDHRVCRREGTIKEFRRRVGEQNRQRNTERPPTRQEYTGSRDVLEALTYLDNPGQLRVARAVALNHATCLTCSAVVS